MRSKEGGIPVRKIIFSVHPVGGGLMETTAGCLMTAAICVQSARMSTADAATVAVACFAVREWQKKTGIIIAAAAGAICMRNAVFADAQCRGRKSLSWKIDPSVPNA